MKSLSRAGGILLHPSSLPGPYGIGDLGPQAYRFVDWLASTGCKLWQVLPLGPTGYGDSPYQCFSAFAGNPYLISIEALLEDGLLEKEDLSDLPPFKSILVEYGQLIPWKMSILQKAFSRFTAALRGMSQQANAVGGLVQEFEQFRAENASWLE